MSDTLEIIDLELRTRIGVPDSERETEQTVRVSVSMDTDTRAVAKDDDVTKETDYDALVRGIRSLATIERKTIERLAEDVAGFVLKQSNAPAVAVSVAKRPFPDAKEVRLTIRRTQADVKRLKGPLIA
jgi:dihydroneopterin aldolase/D-erythro-7,8-dihydroneopterin triphosphate epimerase